MKKFNQKKMNMQKIAFLIVLGVISVVVFIYLMFDIKFDREEEKVLSGNYSNVEVVEEWGLPKILDEVSGIAMIDEERIAAIQDENGIIFIYNLSTSKIEDQINFGNDGDYEGIALVGNTAYVLRSDGNIFEVKDYLNSKNPETVEHKTAVQNEFNFEGLAYDKANNRLLLAAKEKAKQDFIPVFAFDLESNSLLKETAYKISFNDEVFKDVKKKKLEKTILPSEINIDPATGKVYILEGVDPKIVILDKEGNLQKLHQLNRNQFKQAEGLTFGDSGEIYISNEGKGGKANILQVKIN